MKSPLLNCLLMAVAASTLVGCEELDDILDNESGKNGQLSISLADAPVDNLTEVNITVTAIELKPKDESANTYTFDNPKRFDLLELQNGNSTLLLTEDKLRAGDYSWVRLILSDADNAQYVVDLNGGQFSLKVPSGSESGLKINTGFSVPENSEGRYTIDFDVRKSLVAPEGNTADYLLKPSLRLVDNDDVGSISGTVDASTVIATECDDTQIYAGLVYIFEGKDASADDIGSANPPVVVAPLQGSSGTYSFKASFLSAGDYTVSYTCDEDDIEANDSLSFVKQRNVKVTAGSTTTTDIQ
ncbi:DUF4382 domain-containing protein [Marinobacter sp. 1Y8]